MEAVTVRQQDVLAFITAFQAQHAMPPTIREIGAHFGITPRAAHDHLRALERKGKLKDVNLGAAEAAVVASLMTFFRWKLQPGELAYVQDLVRRGFLRARLQAAIRRSA